MPAIESGPAPATPRRRSARGERRHEALCGAAAELIRGQGFASVSHRAVAQLAGLPLAATTYYFSSLDDLLEQAVHRLARQWMQRARDALAGLPPRLAGPRQLAEALTSVVIGIPNATVSNSSEDLLVLYERYLEAGRHRHLRPLVAAYTRELDALVAEVLARAAPPADPVTAPLVLALIDGAVLRALAEGADPTRAASAAAQALLGLSSGG